MANLAQWEVMQLSLSDDITLKFNQLVFIIFRQLLSYVGAPSYRKAVALHKPPHPHA
ncbi:hypothetical protein DPMN_039796 [Dreissena polymorpha]|uniref:Uncharacterized protein n=1 Tax=Dreissena polymorpha TaxID=45954 RepID=A0A9D4CVX7_DREPO|nr:hypothetical protein DPMN_039796 [Dreissena polymorpha]